MLLGTALSLLSGARPYIEAYHTGPRVWAQACFQSLYYYRMPKSKKRSQERRWQRRTRNKGSWIANYITCNCERLEVNLFLTTTQSVVISYKNIFCSFCSILQSKFKCLTCCNGFLNTTTDLFSGFLLFKWNIYHKMVAWLSTMNWKGHGMKWW
jgi:hypothetical protein